MIFGDYACEYSHIDGKTYEHASNAFVNFHLAWVKSVPNFTLFCRKNELCRHFVCCRVILTPFKLVNCYLCTLKRGKLDINHIVVGSIYVWQSYFAQTFYKIHF